MGCGVAVLLAARYLWAAVGLPCRREELLMSEYRKLDGIRSQEICCGFKAQKGSLRIHFPYDAEAQIRG